MKSLDEILNYYIEGIMNEYNITDKTQAESILAGALENDKSDITITEVIENTIERH
ncbi:hypothetical protein [Litchfieldia alkalitelluris]|uniref:hypothetical protein n=1 Tax=Litchfieldia alkalitelluris TaxID=304268 RepID=UPI00147341BD|nr:hypothetical protein [Litchfieldia alkalitelluris]